MDPTLIIASIQAILAIGLPFLLASVKNAASKAKMKKSSPGLRAAGVSLIQIADAIDAVPLAAKRKKR